MSAADRPAMEAGRSAARADPALPVRQVEGSLYECCSGEVGVGRQRTEQLRRLGCGGQRLGASEPSSSIPRRAAAIESISSGGQSCRVSIAA